MRGHIRKLGKRKDGTWRWVAFMPDPSKGGTAKIQRTFRRKEEAEDWLVSEGASKRQGTWVDPRQAERPFRDVIAAWRESWLDIEPKTRSGYETIIRCHLLPEFGNTPVSRVTTEAVQAYVNRLAKTAGSGTVRNIFAALRNALNTGVRLKLLVANPCVGVKLPRARRREPVFLTADEVRALADAITPHYRILVWMAAYTGLRAGEIHGLRLCDVDVLRGVVHVRQALKDVNGHLHFGPTKTHDSRTVSLPAFLRAMLNDHLAALPPGTPEALVFPSQTGKPLRHDLFFARHFKPAVRKALPADKHGLRFHDLRHTCASLSIAAGAHPKLISARLGHSSIQITMDRYGHLYDSAEEALAESLDAAFVAAGENAAGNVVAIGR
jgi:integrase